MGMRGRDLQVKIGTIYVPTAHRQHPSRPASTYAMRTTLARKNSNNCITYVFEWAYGFNGDPAVMRPMTLWL